MLSMVKKINIKEWVAQFKGLDAKDVCLVMTAGFFADWQGQFEQLEAGAAAETKLKADYRVKYNQAVNLDLYKKQLVEVNRLLGSMLRQLPNRSQMDTLITDINNAGTSHKLQFEFFKPASQETKNEIYEELPISIKVLGRYHDMGAFVAEIGQLSRIVTINDINIGHSTSPGLPPETLFLEATAKTFRYLDEEELAQARAGKLKKNKPAAAAIKSKD